MSEVEKTTTAPAVAKKSVPTKLTDAEQNKWYAFIGKCVTKNINFPSNNKFGVIGALTVQDLCNSSIVTLQAIGTKVLKEQDGHNPRFSETEELKINKVPARDWVEFLELTIQQKKWEAFASTKRAKIKELHAEIAAALTPEEKRKQAEVELAALNLDFTEETD